MRGFIRQNIVFVALLLGFSFIYSSLIAQTDTEFWFVAPEVTISHQIPGGQPASLRFATGLLPATVTISMPANRYDPATNPTGFQDIVFDMLAHSFHIEDVTCWIMTPCTPIPVTSAAAVDVNKMENKPLNASGINKFGIHITATNPITAYYEVSRQNNKDIWALKGSNGLGLDFYTPFQTNKDNQSITPVQPYSAIDVVATRDFTQVTFQLPTLVPAIAASYGLPYTNLAASGSVTVPLMRGQTFSLFPLGQSRAAANRLRGTHITSNLPIAVSLKDDSFLHTGGGCYDIAGDQLVPTNIIGKEYAVIRTDLYQTVSPDLNRHDHIYILATQDATQVTVYKTDGTVEGVYNLNAGKQQYVRIWFPETFYRIVSTKPVYVWHVGGFGCEQGGAILPPIDICTGTTQVAFARTSTETFYIIMMVRKGAETGFLFDGVVRNDLFPPASFVSIAPTSKWSVARFGPFTTAQIAANSHFMENSKDIFHLGIVNGGSSSGCFYGYFSDYNELKIEAVVAGTNSSVLKTCYGNPVQLRAFGGTDYLWSPDSSLSDPTSQLPMATPLVNTKYQVVVSGACDMTDTAFIDVLVSTQLSAAFITDKVEGCAPLTVNFEDKSTGIKYWRYDFGDGTPYLKYDNDLSIPDPPPPSPFTFTHTFQNNTNAAITYKVVLLAKNADYCSEVYEKFITVYPSINASYTQNLTQGCNPLAITFTNASSSNTADSYLWEYGDGFNEVTSNPIGVLNHTFSNSVPRDTTYAIRMISTSPFGCKDTATSTATVYSYFDAGFTVNVTSGCSPVTVSIHNTSVGNTARYRWTLDGVLFKTTGLDTTMVLTNNASNTYKDFVIQLQVFNSGDRCSKTVTKTIRVYPLITAGFTIPLPATYCNLTNVVFTNTTTPVTTNPGGITNVYSWDLGDGANSAVLNPTHTYDNQTNTFKDYSVTLTARNQFGCQSVATRSLRIYSQIYADFAVTTNQDCSPVTASIDNNSRGGIVSYLWNYGDLTTGTTNLDHTHPYVNNGLTSITRTINLTVTNEGLCTSTQSHDVEIYPSVTASFTPSVVAGCNPLTVTFDNTSKTNATYYNWNFGDGETSVSFEPSHTFTNTTGVDANYTVTLNVLTDYGCSATATASIIKVYPFIDAQFAIDNSSGCSPLDVLFTYIKHTGITEYRWDWDGGGTTDATTLPANPAQILHQYVNQTGALQVQNPKLTVINHANCSDVFQVPSPIPVYPEVTAAFTKSAAAGCNPLTVNFTNSSFFTGTASPLVNTSYYWDYGDGGSSVVKSPSHQFFNDDPNNNIIYPTQLQVISEYGCASTTSQNIEIYNRVESHFTFEHASNCTPFNVTFTPSAIGASVYNWTYGAALPPESFVNGNPFTRQFTNLDPNNPVTYTIKLEVRNNEGCPSVLTRDLEVYPVVDALFVPSVTTGCSDLSVLFNNTSSGGNMLYLWDFGNGQSASTITKLNVSQLFTNRGSIDSIYPVELKTINPNGCRDSLSINITVHPKIEAGFVFAQQSPCTPFNLDLTNTSLNGNRFLWSTIYNGSIVKLNKTTFSYPIDNTTLNDVLTETIKLVTQDIGTGCADSISKNISVYPRIVSRFDVNKDKGCNPLSVSFTNNSSGLGTYLWEFGDGGTSVATTPAPHSYSHPYSNLVQTYTVKLTATNSFGCKSDRDTLLTVYPLVKADFQWNKVEGCTPLSITLNNSSVSPLYKYSWNFGDGSSLTTIEQPISHTYTNSTNSPPIIQTPTITLRTSYVNDTTCIDSLRLPIQVFPHIYPNFSFTNPVDCHPLITNINNSTVSYNSLTTYSWSLGNGTFSTLTNLANQQYKNISAIKDTTYNIKLTATSVHQCVDEITKSVIVHPRPIASYIMNNESLSCSPFPINLTNLSTGTNLSYLFDLGDGTTIPTANRNQIITHTYHNLSSDIEPYVISLEATTEFGCQNSTSQTIFSYPEVTSDFTFNPGNAACSPFTVSLNNSSSNAYFYQWNFDDLTNSNLMSPNHRFVNLAENDRIFNVHLRSISEYDCEDDTTIPLTVYATPIANFSVDPPLKIYPDATFNFHNQSNPAADSWNYFWTFGDGYTSTLKEAGNHTYASWALNVNDNIYTATLKVDAPHCSSTTSNILRLLPAEPIPFFTADIYNSCSPLEIHPINVSKYGDSYEWDFGDGITSNEFEPIHVFTEPGYYNVKLKVVGEGGVTFHFKTFRVYQNPIADFAIYPNHVMLPDATVHIYNLTKYGDHYEWDLGDNSPIITDRDPVYKYNDLGEFRVSLRAFAADSLGGCQDFTTKFPAVWVEGIGKIVFPNAFMPSKTGANGGQYDEIDYKNEVFHPVHYGVVEYRLIIFNRWGEQIFQSDDVKVGWDGYFQGKLCDQGVYIWRAIGKYTNGKAFDRKGNVTLLR